MSEEYDWASMHAFMIELKFGMPKECVRTVSESLNHAFDRLVGRIDEETKGMSPEEANDYAQWYADEAFNLQEHFPQFTFAALFIGIFSVFEQELALLCRSAHFWLEAKHKWPKGGTIEDMRKFLDKLPGASCPKDTEWNRIERLNDLRNVIAHIGPLVHHIDGTPSDSKQGRSEALHQLLKDSTHASVDERGEIILTADFCFEAIETFQSFLVSTTRKMPKSARVRSLRLPSNN